MDRKPRPDRARASLTEHDFWPLFVRFALSQKNWWIALCAEFDLSPMQGHALRILDPERPLAMSALADSLACDASNVTGIVDKLESRGLIVRQGAGHDRRIKMLLVTAQGRALREQLWTRTMEPPAAVTAMAPAVRRSLAEVLQSIIDEREATALGDRAAAVERSRS